MSSHATKKHAPASSASIKDLDIRQTEQKQKDTALRRSRTGDLVITSDALYQLSYQGLTFS